MAVEIFNIVGVCIKDVSMPGRLYLSEEGDLTRNLRRAKLVPEEKLGEAIEEVKCFSPYYFREEVTPMYR